ncbi:MAG: hypothetical protein HUJ77_07370 [Clostridium sp.]|uniref:hypothetical protein n=1 Tax=Clostridium sp. TaxID=1506 RepID=UPI0025C0204F|nr:hypothetical protein [Clostridium sp.]MCF0148202.1 hypothetical protein [Clostridium sp.]
MENEDIKEKVEEVPKKSMRDTLYGNIDVSVKTMDKIIIVLFILIFLSLLIGIIL